MTKATAGRPTEYDQKYNSLVEGMFRGGATNNEVIKALGVARSTFYLWKQEHFDSGRMEESLKSKSAGFYVLEEVMTEEDDGGNVLKKVTRRKQMPPDTAALKYWLGNRQPDRWREQLEEAGGGHDDAQARARMRRKSSSITSAKATALSSAAGSTSSAGWARTGC